jgi:hypothetical protein
MGEIPGALLDALGVRGGSGVAFGGGAAVPLARCAVFEGDRSDRSDLTDPSDPEKYGGPAAVGPLQPFRAEPDADYPSRDSA